MVIDKYTWSQEENECENESFEADVNEELIDGEMQFNLVDDFDIWGDNDDDDSWNCIDEESE